jgi:arylsulfatase A-like enzyme
LLIATAGFALPFKKLKSMRRLYNSLCSPGLIFILAFSSQTLHAQKAKPNIIYIMADDLGYADLSCYGRNNYQTPNLDKLASQGVMFTNAYATAPVCTPTRVAFMTGRYPAHLQVGLYEPIAEGHQDSLVGLTPAVPSIATRIKSAGYETYLVGKWHLGYQPETSPRKNGFDYFYGFHAGAIDYVSHGNDLYENETPIKREGYLTDVWAEKAVEIIKKPHAKPYLLTVMFNAPHWPWEGPGDKAYPDTMRWTSGGSPAVYAAMMKSFDDAVGQIIKAVDEEKNASNTVIIFTSDNGGERYSDNGIYKGKKMQLWEGGIREPAFVRWPGQIKAGTKTNQVVTTMDWTATILALAGAKAISKFPLEGADVMPVLTRKTKEFDRTLYWRVFQRMQHKAIRSGKWKYLQDEKGNEYLFDLDADPGEENNLKEKQAAIFNQLKSKYGAWEATVLKPVPLPNN